MITLQDLNSCPVKNCELKEEDCTTDYTGSAFYFETTDPWNLQLNTGTMITNAEKACLKCSNENDFSIEKVFEIKLNCSSYWSLNTAISIPSIPFGEAFQVFLADSTTLVTNSQPSLTPCAISQCTLQAADCTSAYSGSKLTMSSSSPFEVTGVGNEKYGWTEQACIKCVNVLNNAEVTTGSIDFNQQDNCLPEWSGTSIPDLTFDFHATDRHVVTTNINSFVTTADSLCPVE